MSLSASVLSDTSKDEMETEDRELTDIVWNLMAGSGLLWQLQGRISKFIEDNGKDENVHIFPDRADPKLLGLIFEYLQWVGLKQTNSVLLSESPVDVDLSIYESRAKDASYKPELCRMLDEQNKADEDRMSGSKSQNYSKDEFEDSKITSLSDHLSAKGNEEDEVEDLASEDEVESKSKQGSLEKSQHSQKNDASVQSGSQKNDASVQIVSQKNDVSVQSEEVKNAALKDATDDDKFFEDPIFKVPRPETREGGMLIDLNSPRDPAKPNVTVRQSPAATDDSNPIASTAGLFQTPRNSSVKPVPNATRLNFVNQPVLEERHETKSETEEAAGAGDKGAFQVVEEPSDQELQKDIPKPTNSATKTDQPSPDDDSTSDFMETLTMEEDTQDVSIPTDSKGMSSCEHAVSLK